VGLPQRRARPWRHAAGTSVGLLLGVTALGGCTPIPGTGPARSGAQGAASGSAAPGSRPAASSASGSGARSGSGSGQAADDPQDPARYAADVVRYAREAGVNAQLVMAILYNESYKPHDAAFERSWQKMDPDAAFGVANMHRAAFDDTKRGRPFARRSWQELPDDPALAVQAQSWYLHDLQRQLPARHAADLTVPELLALGYNAGPGNMRAFARGVPVGPQAGEYLGQFRHNWPIAADVLAHPPATR